MTENGIFLIETGCILPMDELKPYKGNAKLHPKAQVEQIAESIKEFGFDDPIGIWGAENTIVEGHGRYLALKKLGITHVPCIRLDHLTDEERRAYTLAHNQTTMTSGFDTAILDLELSEISIDMSRFGFEVEMGAEEEAKEDDYDLQLPEEPKSKRGDVYQLGRHRLMCGDSTSTDDVATLVDGEKIDLLVTDPPYGVSYQTDISATEACARKRKAKGEGIMSIVNDNLKSVEFVQFLYDAFTAAKSVMRAGACFYVWYAAAKALEFFTAMHRADIEIRQVLIWKKGNISFGRQDYQWDYESCLYGWTDGAAHMWTSDRKQRTVVEYAKPAKSDIHPMMKPIPLFDYQIKNNTHEGDKVLDLFGGSGTTIMACEQNGRNAFVMEFDPKYVDAIIDRWETFTGEKAVLLERPTDNGGEVIEPAES